jgi:hypothetical protein
MGLSVEAITFPDSARGILSVNMATYTPAILIETKAFGNGSGNIATWERQNTAGAGKLDIHRTLVVDTPSSSRTVTIESGTDSFSITDRKLIDAYPLTANVTFYQNWFVTVPNFSYFHGFANNTDINGKTSGYTYA